MIQLEIELYSRGYWDATATALRARLPRSRVEETPSRSAVERVRSRLQGRHEASLPPHRGQNGTHRAGRGGPASPLHAWPATRPIAITARCSTPIRRPAEMMRSPIPKFRHADSVIASDD